MADGPKRIQQAITQVTSRNDTVVSAADVIVTNVDAETMTASQWAAVSELRNTVPDATVVLRMHTVSWKPDRTITVGPFFGILVTQCVGPFTLRREFAVVDEGV